jgi:tRNA A37 methylthiotransferase MiaB
LFLFRKAEKSNIPVVLCGCVPQGSKNEFQNHSIVGVQQIDQIEYVVKSTLENKKVNENQNMFFKNIHFFLSKGFLKLRLF